MIKRPVYVLALVFLFTGCSIFVKAPVQEVKGDDVVCILFNDRRLKTEVVGNLRESLSKKVYKVVTDNVKRAKYYRSSDYGAVVYMTEYWAWHTPWHAKRYHKKNNMAQNTVFVVTSGDPDVTIKEPFDAVTSVSKLNEVERVSKEIIEKLDSILGN